MIQSKEIQLVKIKDVKLNPKNRNKHTDEQIDRLVKIIEYQGFRSPLIVSKRTGVLVAGHGRLMAAKKMKLKEVPVMVQDFTDDAQEYAAMVSDNAIASWAELDLSSINTDIPDLGPDFDLDLLGIKNFEIEEFEGQCDEDDVPGAPTEPITKRGDIWQLGRHRLMCGDSTVITDVEQLMGDEKADLWITDPPYGVAYKSKGTDKHRPIENDAMPLDEMKDFWQQVAANALICTSNKSSYYWFACQGGDQMMMMMMMALGDAGWQVKHELIWLKDRMVLARCDYHYKHEPIIYGWKRDGTHEWFGDRTQTSVLEFARPKSSDLHPTMKPVELVEYLMKNNSKPGQLVLETFGGSGTTVIAAEKSDRRCNAIEIDPRYCDVIINRWQNYTGQKAKLGTT